MSNTIIISTLSMAGLGLLFASILAFANQKLKVEENPLVEKISHELPNVNCGACGFASCRQFAEALVKKDTTPDKCKASGEEQRKKIAEILGISFDVKIKETAFIHCGADNSVRKKKAVYSGIETCLAANNVFGGALLCDYGCLGYGDCETVCPFGAITMVNGLPKVDKNKCTACGKCATICPRGIISIVQAETPSIDIACSSCDKGAETRKSCSLGCIGCGICQKLTNGIFYVENNLARVKRDRIKEISNTEEVLKKCPTKCITKV